MKRGEQLGFCIKTKFVTAGVDAAVFVRSVRPRKTTYTDASTSTVTVTLYETTF